MTWLLPLVAPVLAVWVRTIQTAGYTTPFNGDHNVFKVLPVLVLVDLLGRGRPLDMTCVCSPFFCVHLTSLNHLVRQGDGVAIPSAMGMGWSGCDRVFGRWTAGVCGV